MEIISRPFNGRNYWKKNGYTLLNGASTAHRKTEVVHFHGDDQTPKKKRWLWRLRKAPTVLVRLSPKRVWGRLRDGYISMMLRVAGNVGRLTGGAELMGKKIPRPARKVKALKKNRVEDFEARLVLEIYKALATSRGVSEL